MEKVLEIINICFQKNIPFAIYRYPGNSKIFTRVQLSGKIIYVENAGEVIDKEGFIYAPFHRKTDFPVIFFEPEIIIENNDVPPDLLDKINNSAPLYPDFPVNIPEETPKSEYLENAENFIKSFDETFRKAVLSRVQIEKKPQDFNPGRYFLKLSEAYPGAFCHLIHIPGAGTWAGATPETLLSSGPEFTRTVSLAGTRTENGSRKWDNKESEEQQIVTDYIENILSQSGITSVVKEKTKTIKAGNALHLSTVFRFKTSEISGRTGQIVEKLHPTPAVCGYPKEKALEHILQTEKHNREYYSGFMGTVNVENATNLFVNLRCMKILPDKLALFIGGGLTKDSVPEKEWEETVLKAETLLALL